MRNEQRISPKLQLLCFDILCYLEENETASCQDLFDAFKEIPEPLIHLACRLLMKHNLTIIDDNDLYKTCVSPLIKQTEWIPKIKEITLSQTHMIYDIFKHLSQKIPYKQENLNNITYKELTIKDYLKAKEFYDYESLTLLEKIGENFFARQFGALQNDGTGEKETIVYIAENDHKNLLGFVAITNYTSELDIGGTLKVPNKNIFNVTFIATRKSAQNKGIAKNLMKNALLTLSARHKIDILCYDPICEESTHVMKRTFPENAFNIHKLSPLAKDYIKYGYYLRGYIITSKHENSFSLSPHQENYEQE